MYVTREVAAPRLYARDRYARNPDARYGLLASAKAKNLSPHGFLNDFAFTQNMRIGPWFADSPESDRSCCSFRETATEFQCQGLELDMPIIGWGDDFVWEQGRWVTKRGLRSRNVVDPQRLRENAYRVLLTRGRDGIAIFVPPESSMDATFNVLLEAGCAEMRIVSLGYKWEV